MQSVYHTGCDPTPSWAPYIHIGDWDQSITSDAIPWCMYRWYDLWMVIAQGTADNLPRQIAHKIWCDHHVTMMEFMQPAVICHNQKNNMLQLVYPCHPMTGILTCMMRSIHHDRTIRMPSMIHHDWYNLCTMMSHDDAIIRWMYYGPHDQCVLIYEQSKSQVHHRDSCPTDWHEW